jgi:hypothetical protein
VILGAWPDVGSWGEWFSATAAVGAIAVAVWLALRSSGDAKRAAIAARDSADAARESVEAARESVAAVRESVEVGRQSVTEAARTRLDAQAPIIALTVGTFHPYYTKHQSLRLPSPGDMDVWTILDQAESFPPQLAADETSAYLLFFVVEVMIRNEGTVSARVMLDPYMRLMPEKQPDREWLQMQERHTPPPLQSFMGNEYFLGAQEWMIVEWMIGHPLGEWVRAAKSTGPSHGRFNATVTASDLRGSILDRIYVEGNGRPMIEVGLDEPSQWRLDRITPRSIHAMPQQVERAYRALGETLGEVKPSF